MLFENLPAYRLADFGIHPGNDGEGAAGGEGGSGAPALTLEQVTTLVNDSVNKTVNNAIANLKKTDFPKMLNTAMEPVTAQLASITEGLTKLNGNSGGNGGGQGNNGGQGGGSGTPPIPPEVNAQLKSLTDKLAQQGKTVTDLQNAAAEANKRAETAEKHSTIRSAMSGVKFASDAAANTAFTLVEPHVVKGEDGSFSAQNLPVSDFIKDFLPKEHAYLIQPTGTSGSGAGNGNGGGTKAGGGKVDINDIKQGMTPEKRAAAIAAIAEATAAHQS